MYDFRNPLSLVGCGEVSGSVTAKVMPTVVGSVVIIKAIGSNAGNVYVGGAGVTVVNGTTDTTSGIELDAGEGLTLYITNLNQLYIICDNAGDDVSYLVLG